MRADMARNLFRMLAGRMREARGRFWRDGAMEAEGKVARLAAQAEFVCRRHRVPGSIMRRPA
ncbi:hypothetical protein MWN34_01995 [Ancylobacter sp. 6x-1]|uniref:CsbD family protein n=1 Tax=Ancylobacter crimeensis TaxID=2579147 RepID=A0ABT0D6W1_9HYPH|nr:hypothetical protein [Ancylobacter crimeensis]MCK0195675.1 hypothetical protein [Ancylobacter crimeensis]